MTELASAFVTLLPSFKGGASAISREIDGPAQRAGQQSGARLGDGMQKGFAPKVKLLAGTLAVGLGIGAGALLGFAKTGVDAFARVEDATGAAGVQFGKQLPQILSFADQASRTIGVSKGAAIDAANTFGTLGKSAGLSGNDLSGFSLKFTQLAGDMASFKGTSPEQAIEAIGAALRGESEPIRAYGVLLDDASLRQEALAQGLIKTTKQALTPQQKVLASQALILKQTSDAQGDFARTSDSTANTQKRLAAETENAQAKLGQQLAPAITLVRQGFLGLIEGASSLADRIGPFMGRAVAAVKGLFTLFTTGDLTGGLLRALGLEEDSSAVAKLMAVQQAVAAFAAFISGTLVPSVLSFGRDALPVVITALTTVGAAVSTVVGFFREHETTAKVLAGVLGGLLVGAWIAQAAVATASAAQSVIAWFTTATAATTSSTIQSRSTAQIVVGRLAASASAVASVAKQVAAWVLLGVQSLLQAARVAAAWLIAMGPVGLVIAAVIGLVALIIKNWDTIKSVTAAAWSWFTQKIHAAVQAVVGFLLNFTGPGLIIKHWDTIKRVTSEAWQAFSRFVSDGVDRVVGIVTGLGARISGAARGVFDGLKDAFRAAVNFIIDGWNGLQFTMPQVDTHLPGVGKVGGFTIGVPNIPRLADGGLVKATPGGQLALLAEAGQDELVLPLGAGDLDDLIHEVRQLRSEVRRQTDRYQSLVRSGAILDGAGI